MAALRPPLPTARRRSRSPAAPPQHDDIMHRAASSQESETEASTVLSRASSTMSQDAFIVNNLPVPMQAAIERRRSGSRNRVEELREMIRAHDDDDPPRRVEPRPPNIAKNAAATAWAVTVPTVSPDPGDAREQLAAVEDRAAAKQLLIEARAVMGGAQDLAHAVLRLVQESAQALHDARTDAKACVSRAHSEATALLEQARAARRQEELEHNEMMQETCAQACAFADGIKQQAEEECRMQEALRQRASEETVALLENGKREMHHFVREAEAATNSAELRLRTLQANAQREYSRAASLRAEMEATMKEAQQVSAAASADTALIRRELRAYCDGPVSDLAGVVVAAKAVLHAIKVEQEELLATQSRGLALESASALRHAVRKKEMRKHLAQWSFGSNVAKFRNRSLQRILHLPDLSLSGRAGEEASGSQQVGPSPVANDSKHNQIMSAAV